MKRTLASIGLAGAVALTLVPAASSTAGAASSDSTVSATAKKCPLVVAHRGGEGDVTNAGENSMAVFRRAADMGVDVMETDVYFTKDLVPVIMHDETLDRTTNATGPVRDYTWAQLKKDVRLNNGERIPSMREALEFFAFRGMPSFMEYKDKDEPKLMDKYLDTLAKYGEDAWAAGFSQDFLNYVHKKDASIPMMWFGLRDGSIPIATEPKDVPTGAQPGLINILQSKELVDKYKAAGMKMNVWFNTATKGDNPTGTPGIPGTLGWEAMQSYGVHWISTDYPDGYIQWTKDTDACDSRPPRVSRTDCVDAPTKLRTNSRYLLLRKGCESSAGKPMTVKVTAAAGTARVIKKNGNTWLKTTSKGGRVKVAYVAPKRVWTGEDGNSWTSYDRFDARYSYTVRPVRARG